MIEYEIISALRFNFFIMSLMGVTSSLYAKKTKNEL